MNCIIVTEDFLIKNNIEKLIISSNLHLLSTCNTISEASVLMLSNCIDVLFFDIQMCDFDRIEFIQNIPDNIFVIYIPELSVFTNEVDNKDLSNSTIAKRFENSVEEARLFQDLIKKENMNITENYCVI